MGIFAILEKIKMRADGNPSLRGLKNAPQPKLQMFLQMTRHPRKGLPPVELNLIIY